MNQDNDNDLKGIEKMNVGLNGVGQLMQSVDYEGVEYSVLVKVGVLIESVTHEIDKKLSKIEE